jgi:hypothetical protein
MLLLGIGSLALTGLNDYIAPGIVNNPLSFQQISCVAVGFFEVLTVLIKQVMKDGRQGSSDIQGGEVAAIWTNCAHFVWLRWFACARRSWLSQEKRREKCKPALVIIPVVSGQEARTRGYAFISIQLL